MARMLPGIETVEQHQERLGEEPDAYRPERCPRCGRAGMHRHGHRDQSASDKQVFWMKKRLHTPRIPDNGCDPHNEEHRSDCGDVRGGRRRLLEPVSFATGLTHAEDTSEAMVRDA